MALSRATAHQQEATMWIRAGSGEHFYSILIQNVSSEVFPMPHGHLIALHLFLHHLPISSDHPFFVLCISILVIFYLCINLFCIYYLSFCFMIHKNKMDKTCFQALSTLFSKNFVPRLLVLYCHNYGSGDSVFTSMLNL